VQPLTVRALRASLPPFVQPSLGVKDGRQALVDSPRMRDKQGGASALRS